MDEYDRWYAAYRRRKAIMEGIGIFLAGVGMALAVFALYVLIVTALGGASDGRR